MDPADAVDAVDVADAVDDSFRLFLFRLPWFICSSNSYFSFAELGTVPVIAQEHRRINIYTVLFVRQREVEVKQKESSLMSSRAALAHISALIKAKRREKKVGLRAAADESGVSASTLSRLERGAATSLPDSHTLTKLSDWLDVSVGSLLAKKQEATGREPQLTTPEIVEVHLRADHDLSPETARALAEMFKTLYQHCLQTQGREQKGEEK